MKVKKILGLGFAGVIMLSNAAFATDVVIPTEKAPVVPISAPVNESTKTSPYLSYSGVVNEIITNDHGHILGLKNQEGNPANFAISDDTYMINNIKIKEGDHIIGFYDANSPMLLIYPPRYNVEVVALIRDGENICVDRFDENLINANGMLKLNIDDRTKITLPDGKPFQGELAQEKLIVLYGPSTKSIPAQTTPTQIIVLPEKINLSLTNTSDLAQMEIVVNNKLIKAPYAYLKGKETIMVPLRAINEALGKKTQWQHETKNALLANDIKLTINQDNYQSLNGSIVQLGASPELVNGTLFVPLKFFKDIMGIEKAGVFEGQIIISHQ